MMSNIDVTTEAGRPVHREKESVDDFEHLGLDKSPSPTHRDIDLATSSATRDLLGEIDITAENAIHNIRNDPLDDLLVPKMDSNLFEMGDTILDKDVDADEKLDKFLSELTSFAPSVPSHDVSPIMEDRKPHFEGIKNFLEMEREKMFIPNQPVEPVKLRTDEIDDLLFVVPKEPEIHHEPLHFEEKEAPVLGYSLSEAIAPPSLAKKPLSEVVQKRPIESPPQPPKTVPPVDVEVEKPHHPIIEPIIEPKAQHAKPNPDLHVQSKVEQPKGKPAKSDLQLQAADAEAIFKKMGLDAWFHPERLNPKVESLIYWRDPTKSGPVFGGVLVVLLALTYLSLISVFAYVSLLALTGTISFRIYKNVLQAVQKTGDGHPFKEVLDMDITLPQEKVKEFVETAVAHLNAAVAELRRLFLVDDLVDSIKFGVLLWCLTYLGSWFNGMTLVIIAWVALFTLPKVYETNKTQIDANLDLVRSKIAEITSKVKAAIPIGKKEEKKEQ